jgi:hypothetical protein
VCCGGESGCTSMCAVVERVYVLVCVWREYMY